MKKKIIGVAVLATVVISAAAWNFNQGKNLKKLSGLMLANIEALASKPVEQKHCPGGRHLCAWVNSTTYYDRNGPDDI